MKIQARISRQIQKGAFPTDYEQENHFRVLSVDQHILSMCFPWHTIEWPTGDEETRIICAAIDYINNANT